MPMINPTAAGTKESLPIDFDCSREGSKRLQIDAAAITPPAKPVRILRTLSLRFLRIKNTQAEPSTVPRKGINIPLNASVIAIYNSPTS